MKAFSYQFFATEEKSLNRKIALFKRVEVIPFANSFLSSKLTLQNYCIMSVQSGQFDWKFNDEVYHITPEDLILVCPGVEMEKNFRPIEKGDFYKISLNPEYYFDEDLQNIMQEDTERSEISIILSQFNKKGVIFLKNGEETKTIFRRLEEEFKNAEIGYRVRIAALINELIISAYRTFTRLEETACEEESCFDELTRSLKENLSHNWTVKEMAGLTQMGVTQLSNRMKARLGYSPFDYLIYLRLNRAISLLKDTDEPITCIALDTGFYSSQHFSNTFKKIMGDSPRNYRKSLKDELHERS